MVFDSALTLATFILAVVVAHFNSWDHFFFTFFKGSGYRSTCGTSYLQPYSSATRNMTVTHEESVLGLAVMY